MTAYGMNNVVLGGTVMYEPDVRSGDNGKSWGSFKINITENFNGRDFYTKLIIKGFGKMAEPISRLRVGDFVMVTGRLQISKFTNKAGVEVEGVQIVANTIASVMRTGGVESTDATGFPPDDGTVY